MEEVIIDRIDWRAPEYAHSNRGIDFFWTIGIVAVLGAILALWSRDFIFAIFILISGFCLIIFTIRKPHEIEFSIESGGISMGRDKYSWKNIKGFDLKTGAPYMKLLIETDKRFLPVYTIPLPVDMSDEVRSSIIRVVPNIELEESQSMLFMERLGF
ncbi:MAG: hypothetical protein WCK91_00010 [bacterium]